MFSLSSKRVIQTVFAILLVVTASLSVAAQSKKKTSAHSEPQKPVIISEDGKEISPAADSKTVTASTKSSNIYVQSLRDQLMVREREVAVAKENLEKTKLLFADGIVSKRSVEEAEVALVEAQTKADDLRRKLSAYEGTSVETNNTTAAETKKAEDETKQNDIVVVKEADKSTVKTTSQVRAKTPVKKPAKKTKRP